MYEIPNTDLIAMDESEYLEHFGVRGMKWGKRKALQPAREKMRAAERIGSRKQATAKQRGAYEEALASYYNKKRKLKGKDTVNAKTAAYRQDIKNDAVRGAKYLAGSFVLDRAAQALAVSSKSLRGVSSFLSNFTAINAGLLKTASVGTSGVGVYYSGRAGVKRIRGGKNGDRN
jgi:hypothetical protein